MRRTSFLVICLFLANMNAIGSQADDNYWQQFVHYTMNVTLEPNKHILSGEETILYKNNSPGTLFKLYMHLYPNAFRNDNSTMAQGAKKMYYSPDISPENRDWSIVEVDTSLSDQEWQEQNG